MNRNRLWALIMALSVWIVAGDVHAQSTPLKVGESVGAWTFRCQAVTPEQNICGLVQVLVNNETKQQALRAVIRPISLGDPNKMGLYVVLPLGIFLAPGIAGKVDEHEQFSFVLQTCTQNGCEAAVDLDDKLQGLMRAGKQLVVGYKPARGAQTVGVSVSLNGFTAGMRALQKSP